MAGKPKAQPRNRASLSIVAGTITINGETREFSGVNYSRVEREDGTVEETGRPEGLPPGASIGEAFAHALLAAADAMPAPPAKKRRRKG